MIAYQTDENGYFIGTAQRQPSPLEPGVWLLPAGAFEEAPPEIPEGFRAKIVDGEWELEEIV